MTNTGINAAGAREREREITGALIRAGLNDTIRYDISSIEEFNVYSKAEYSA